MSGRILKKSHDRKLAGVCGGLAEFLGWQPGQVRAIFALVALLGGAGLLAYLILAIAMPAADSGSPGRFNLDDHRKQ
jgi:phage shock protein PspC (stress-responsive transcriptional regulator)